jgi:hypothetical protein
MKKYAAFFIAFTLVFPQFYANIGLAGHENVQYQSYYPHEIRFLQVDNLDSALKYIILSLASLISI